MSNWRQFPSRADGAVPPRSPHTTRSPLRIFGRSPAQSIRTDPSKSLQDTRGRPQRSRSRSRGRNPLLTEIAPAAKPAAPSSQPPATQSAQSLEVLETQLKLAKGHFAALKAQHEIAAASVVYLTAADPRLRAMELQAEQLRAERTRLEKAVAEREQRLQQLEAAVSSHIAQASAVFQGLEARNASLYAQQLLFKYTNNDAEALRFLDARIARLERRRAPGL